MKMKKKIITTSSVLFGTLLMAGVSMHIVFAAATSSATSSTKGERMLQDMINAESARSAELNVALDPKLGITHTLRRRSTGNGVKLLQQFLKVYGAYPEGLITGYFGPLTERAVKKFQKKESIDPVGIAGPKTRARIIAISQQKTSKNPTAPNTIDAVLAADVAENGAAVAPIVSFASTTQNIYAVISLKGAAQDTKIGYVRYYGGTFVDSGVSHPNRDNLGYFHFQWSQKPGSNRLTGNYSLVFYINGKSVKTIQYTIY